MIDFIGHAQTAELRKTVSAVLTYDGSGNLATYTSSKGTKTFAYSSGVLSSITGTGDYVSKTFTYNGGGQLTNVTVV